jgi:hypothetical protein
MMNKLTQINLYDPATGGLKGFGPLGLEQNQDGVTVFTTFISSAIGLITLIGIIWFVFIFITGALGIITSGGDKNSLESAKKKISSGLIGLVVMFFAMLIIGLTGAIFGLGEIFNIQYLFGLLQIK